ncbi:hypothetical protein TNCV_3586911 [Trichonephila clavipes]|nr:hypothetical protein TNCV_3586911 [Trichonephila clavipes]
MRGTLTGQRCVDDILTTPQTMTPRTFPANGLLRHSGTKGNFPARLRLMNLVRIQHGCGELLKTWCNVIFRLFHGRPAPPICPLLSPCGIS